MRFLKTLFWIVVAVGAIHFAANNWRDVTIDLWGNLQAEVKMPVLLLLVFLIGFLPTWLSFRTKLWRVENSVSIARDSQQARAQPETTDE